VKAATNWIELAQAKRPKAGFCEKGDEYSDYLTARSFLASWVIVKFQAKTCSFHEIHDSGTEACHYRLLLHLGDNNTITNFRIKKSLIKLTPISDNQSAVKSPRFRRFFCSLIFPLMEMRHKSGSAHPLLGQAGMTRSSLHPEDVGSKYTYQTRGWKSMETRFFLLWSVWNTPPRLPPWGLLPLRKPLFHNLFPASCSKAP
jgi:hypothetical protein